MHWSRFDAGEILLENGRIEGKKQMSNLNNLIRKTRETSKQRIVEKKK